MPPVGGAATAGRFLAHADHGLESSAGRALSVIVDVPADAVVRPSSLPVRVLLQNTGAGHSFPTGTPYRAGRLEIGLLDSEGESLVETVHWELRRSVEGAPPYQTTGDTRLKAGDQRTYEHTFDVGQAVAAGAGTLQVTVLLEAPDGNRVPVATQSIPLEIQ